MISDEAVQRRRKPAFYAQSFWEKTRKVEVERKLQMEVNEKAKLLQHLERDYIKDIYKDNVMLD